MSRIQNIDVRFNATSNFTKVKADLKALQAEAASLGAVFERSAYAKPPGAVDPTRWKVATEAVHRASRVYRDAASSSGLMTTQQIRATSEAERYTKALQKQKLSMGEMIRNRGVMKQVYADQLKYQRMSAQYWGTDMSGRAITDIAIPKNVPADLDTMRRKMGMVGHAASSAGTQIVNMGKNIQWSGRQLTVGFTYPLALFGAAAGVMAYKVEDAYGKINKVYDVSAAALQNETLRTKELGELRVRSTEMAKKVAEEYGLSIEKTLEVEQQLAATGLKGNDLLSTTKEVQRISAIGDIDPAQTSDMIVALKTAFKETIPDAKSLTDNLNYMNAASNATSLSLQDIAEATPRAASAMSALGVTAKQMTVMLVSMRESGTDAAEAANALKSATGTILAPSPAALEFVKEIGGKKMAEGIKGLAQSSGGNLYLAMEQLYKLTKDLDDTSRQQIIVKLFGKYQFNRVSGMLKNLGDAFDGTQNQARKAMDLMAQSSTQNAKQADASLKSMMDNSAGRFKAAWASVKASLAELGTPFLDLATQFMEMTSTLVNGFNKLPDGTKKLAMISAGAIALAGPLIMIGGLVANLAGQFIKGTGGMLKFIGISKLVTKEEQAAALSAQAQNKAMMQSQATTSTLAQEINVLTQAYALATKEAIAFAEANGVAAAKSAQAAGMIGPQTQKVTGLTGAYANARNGKLQLSSQEQSYYSATSRQDANGKFLSNQVRLEQARNKLATDYMRANNQVARDASFTEKKIASENKYRQSINKNMAGAAASGGVMAASMAVMMTTSNATANSIAKWAMIGALVVPAATALLGTMGSAAKAGWSLAASSVANARATATGAASTGVLAGAMATARGAAIGFGTAINSALGPIGWIVLGLTAVVGTVMLINNHQKKLKEQQEAIVKKQLDANKALENSSASIATSLGKAAGSYKQIAGVGAIQGGTMGANDDLLNRYNYYKGDGKSELAGFVDQSKGMLYSTDILMDKARQKFIDLQVLGGDTANQARIDLQAMLTAAGMASTEALALVDSVYKKYGNISKLDWTQPLRDQATALNNLNAKNPMIDTKQVGTPTSGRGGGGGMMTIYEVNEGNRKIIEGQAKKAASIFNQALASATTPEDQKKVINQYMGVAMQEWDKGFKTLKASDTDRVKDLFKDYGIESSTEFADAWNNNAAFKDAIENLVKNPATRAAGMELMKQILPASEWEKTIIKPMAKDSNRLADSIWNVAGALKGFNAEGIGVTSDEAAKALMSTNEQYLKYAAILERIREIHSHGDGGKSNQKELLDLQNQLNATGNAATVAINKLNKKFGFAEGKNAAEALNNLLNHTKKSADDGKRSVDNLNRSIKALPSRKTTTIQVKQVGGIMQSAMSSVQDQMVQGAQDKFNAGWDARIAGVQAAQDAASNALEAGNQRAQDAFDARWEHRKDMVNKAYQARIDAINREIKREQDADATRQRIFEKEKARLAALAASENNDIDFNTALNEGRLDDAAKTLNNAQSGAANDQMDAEQKAAEARSEARIAALEKKNERLEKQRDRELKQLEKMEDRMKKHLERIQTARSNALAKQNTDVMNSLTNQRNMEEATLNARLDLFKAYTAMNKKDLEAWMKELGFKYDDFGKNVTKKGRNWAESIQASLDSAIRQAGTEVMSDNMWEGVGKGMADSMVKGMGFKDMADFRHFVKTGEKGKGKTKTATTGTDHAAQTRHGGGIIGSGPQSTGRAGIPNTFKGLHRSEQLVRAQKGEYMVNRKEAKRNLPLLKMINGGKVPTEGIGGLPPANDGYNYAVPSFGGPGALMAGVVSNMFAKGMGKAMKNNFALGKSRIPKATAGKNPGNLKQLDVPPIGGANAIGSSAISWALGQIGVMGWYNRCLSFVRQSLGAPGGVYDAKTSWYGTRNKYSAANPSKIPAGVPVFWTTGNNGHVVLSTGGGGAISTDHPNFNTAGRTTIGSLSSWLGAPPAGWAGDINGKSVFPSLRTGGTLRADTMVNAHRGETVLTAPLTEQFKKNVANGGGDTFHVTLDLRGATIKEDVDVERAVNKAIDQREAKVGRKRVVN